MTNVQIRDVPDDVVDALKTRAAENGQSLQRFLFDILTGEAEVARNAVLLDEAAADPGGYPAAPDEAADLVRQDRAERERALAEPRR